MVKKQTKQITSKTKRWNDWDLNDVYYRGIEQGKQTGSKEEQERIIEIIMKWWNTEKDVPSLIKEIQSNNLKSPRVEKSVEIQNYEPTNGVSSANRMHTTVERSSTHSDSLFKTKSPYRVGN